MRPVHRYLCYATEQGRPRDGPSATAPGSVASLACYVHSLMLGDEAHDCIRPAVDMHPLAVANAVAIGCDVDDVAEAVRLRYTISRLFVRDHDQTVVRQVAHHLDRGAELRTSHARSRVDRIPQCHARPRRHLDAVVTEGKDPHRLAHAPSHDRDACRLIRTSHIGLA